MNGRERLSKLVEEAMQKGGRGGKISDVIADHLLNNGVVVPPCRMGETVYKVIRHPRQYFDRIYIKKQKLTRPSFWHSVELFGTRVFRTEAEARAAMDAMLEDEKRRVD